MGAISKTSRSDIYILNIFINIIIGLLLDKFIYKFFLLN